MPRIRTSVWFFVVLVTLASLAIIIPYVYNVRSLLKPEDVELAQQRWSQHGPADYELIWSSKQDAKNQPSTISILHIKVRAGKVTELKVDDRPIDLTQASPDRLEMFTAPGLLKRIAQELNQDLNSGERRNYITAYFDPKTGCPFRYVRRMRESKIREEWIIKLNP